MSLLAALAALPLLTPSAVHADSAESMNYRCGRYEGSLRFYSSKRTGERLRNVFSREFGLEYPDQSNRLSAPVATSRGDMHNCSNQKYLCAAEQDGSTGEMGFVYAAPKNIRKAGTFELMGRVFNLSVYPGNPANGKGFAEIWSTNSSGEKYKFLIEGRRGIVFLHYSKLHMHRLEEGEMTYGDASCNIEGQLGLLSGVRIFDDPSDTYP